MTIRLCMQLLKTYLILPVKTFYSPNVYFSSTEVKCPAILDSAYIISRKDHHFGVQVNYTCIDKFTFPNTTKKTYKLSRCQYDGQWTPKLAECIRMYLYVCL